jgi:hypothetical protein
MMHSQLVDFYLTIFYDKKVRILLARIFHILDIVGIRRVVLFSAEGISRIFLCGISNLSQNFISRRKLRKFLTILRLYYIFISISCFF